MAAHHQLSASPARAAGGVQTPTQLEKLAVRVEVVELLVDQPADLDWSMAGELVFRPATPPVRAAGVVGRQRLARRRHHLLRRALAVQGLHRQSLDRASTTQAVVVALLSAVRLRQAALVEEDQAAIQGPMEQQTPAAVVEAQPRPPHRPPVALAGPAWSLSVISSNHENPPLQHPKPSAQSIARELRNPPRMTHHLEILAALVIIYSLHRSR
jgi:hypothetical protein